MILAKIDVTKIDKSRLFKGQKGKYLDICLIETPNDQYGNAYMVTQSVSKEERDKGVKGAILGNAKIVGKREPAHQSPSQQRPPAGNPEEDVSF